MVNKTVKIITTPGGAGVKIGIDGRAAIWYRGTGIGTYTYQLIRSLHQLKHQHQMRVFWPGDEYRELDPTADAVFNSLEKYREKFWESIHIPNRITDEAIDIYHVPQNGIGLPVSKTCPLVVTIHDLIPYVYPETVGKGYLKIFLEEMPRIIEMSDHIITVSAWSKRDLMQVFNVPGERITVTYEAPEDIYYPIDREEAKRYLAENYAVPERFILYLGGFGPRKNVQGLIRAFHALKRDLPFKCSLVLVGKEARDFRELAMMVEALGIEKEVVFPGFVPVEDLPIFYSGADLFVYPSFYEGFGLPPLEAMACGAPVVTSDLSSIPEVVGDAAVLVNPYDTVSLAEGMYAILADPKLAEEYRTRGFKRVKEFSWLDTAQKTLDIYEQTMIR